MAGPYGVGHRPQLEDCADESGLAYERDASMSSDEKLVESLQDDFDVLWDAAAALDDDTAMDQAMGVFYRLVGKLAEGSDAEALKEAAAGWLREMDNA